MRGKIILTITFLATALGTVLFAQPGGLDGTFDTDGKQTTGFGAGRDEAWSVAIQPDGKILVAGISSKVTNHDFTLVRYNIDGTLDTSFSKDGVQTTAFGLDGESASVIVIQPDGKIIVAGNSSMSTNNAFLLARYNTEGILDTTFSTDGKLTTIINGHRDFAKSIAIQPDGKIVVAGWSYSRTPNHGNDFALVRYNTNGTLDHSFGTNGTRTTNFGSSILSNDSAYSVAIQPDGKIVVAGGALLYSDFYNNDFAVARYKTDGALDSTFGTNGKLVTAFGSYDEVAYSAVIQSDKKIIVAGYSYSGTDKDFALARFDTTGALDTTFDMDGMLITDFGGNDLASSIAIQPDGKIVVAGYSYNGTDSDFALARYNADGTLDSSFGGDGKLLTDFGWDDQAHSIALQQDGKIVAAGNSNIFFNGDDDRDSDFALARYNTNGTLDSSFSNQGRLITSLDTDGNDHANAVAIQPDGMIVTAGSSTKRKWISYLVNSVYFSNFALARYDAAGALDENFGQKGIKTTAIGTGSGNEDYAYSIALHPDGKIVAAGHSFNGIDKDFALARYDTYAKLDTTFSMDGTLTTDFGRSDEIIYAVSMQADGKIIAAGYSHNGLYKDFALARYNTSGALDSSFGIDGILTTAFGFKDAIARSLSIQSDEKLVVVGSSDDYTFAGFRFTSFALARYNIDGTLDNTFGTNGKVTTNIGPIGRNEDYAFSSVLQPDDGKIIVAGYSYNGMDKDFALARYNTDGSLDSSFSDDGILTTDFGWGDDVARSVALLPDGKIVAVGSSFHVINDDFALAVYNADGMLDNNYGTGGRILTDIGEDDVANSVLIQQTGEIVAVGTTFNGRDYDFALARYLSELNVGVIDFSASNSSAIIYPNPIGQNSTLEYSLSDEEKISIHLLDMQGKTLKTIISQQKQEAGKHQQAITLPNILPAGSYLISISSPRGRMSVRIIKYPKIKN